MLNKKINIIPAIDIIEGRCVRLSQGDYAQKKVYDKNPLDIAKDYEGIGIEFLHIVDLDGAKSGAIKNFAILEGIAKNTNLKIDFGGGIKTKQDVSDVLNAGATFATIGSLAVKNKKLWQEIISTFGAKKIMLGADVKDEKIAVSAWLEQTEIRLEDFILENKNLGITNIFITDISKDGLLQGTATALYRKICNQFSSLNIIASGGVDGVQSIKDVQAAGCSGVIIGKAIYENKISLKELQTFL